MSLSLLHPKPLQEALQANSLQTPPHLLSPHHPLVREPCSIFFPGLKMLRQVMNPRTLVLPSWRDTMYQLFESTSNKIALHTL